MLVPSGACPGLGRPVPGEVVRIFEPIGRYGGHWGIDLAANPDTVVHAADDGVVTFAGEVVGVLSITVNHGGGLRTSYSCLASIAVVAGELVARSTELGRSGLDHGVPALHLSVRIGDEYQDPLPWLRCFTTPQRALRLIPIPHAYASRRATRHSRRDIRSTTSSSLVRR